MILLILSILLKYPFNFSTRVTSSNNKMKEYHLESPDDLPEQVAALRTALLNLINDSFETNAKLDKLTEQINLLRVSQKETDERLNAVITMAEKFFSGENGDSENKN